jgi:hypothetical protein
MNTNMSRDLLPCPFCGGEPEIERLGTARCSMIIVCSECGCRLETGETFLSKNCLWNSRPQTFPQVAALEALKFVPEEVLTVDGTEPDTFESGFNMGVDSAISAIHRLSRPALEVCPPHTFGPSREATDGEKKMVAAAKKLLEGEP